MLNKKIYIWNYSRILTVSYTIAIVNFNVFQPPFRVNYTHRKKTVKIAEKATKNVAKNYVTVKPVKITIFFL